MDHYNSLSPSVRGDSQCPKNIPRVIVLGWKCKLSVSKFQKLGNIRDNLNFPGLSENPLCQLC